MTRRTRTWVLGAVVALVWAGVSAKPASAREPAEKRSWFSNLFGKSEKDSTVKDANGQPIPRASKLPGKKSAEATREASVEMEMEQKKAAAARLREEAKLFRRQAVCDELKNVASENNDDALWKQAEELDRRAYALYSQRVGKAIVNRADLAGDEAALKKRNERASEPAPNRRDRAVGARAARGDKR